ncbi:MAG: Rieske 2Fe-2S domain-containing protein, partial [Thiobacillus sp.]|nr:Rieske 2Fe-2S domain-containing protein [Thiobacillus sp.]
RFEPEYRDPDPVRIHHPAVADGEVLDAGFHAIEDACSHDGGELASGTLVGREITCPRHGAGFDITTGAVTAPPAYEAVAVLPVRITAGQIEVRDDRWD